jgi:hypothetical protein
MKVLAFLLLALAGPAFAVCGDVNGDGAVNIGDALAIAQCDVGLRSCAFPLATCGPTPACSLPESGQTTCWDSSGVVIPCAGTGQDGDTRTGRPLVYVDNGDGTITDMNTSLVWEKKSEDGSIHDISVTYTWAQAFSVHVAGLNAVNFAGHNDWRVPNVKELESIVNFEHFYPSPSVSPAFNNGCAPGCTVLTCSCTVVHDYWSSNTYANTPQLAWVVYFGGGNVNANFKSDPFYVRAVRGGS